MTPKFPAAILLAAMVTLTSGSGARAHGDMLSQDPPADSVIAKPVDHIRINFTETPTEDASVTVTDGCGTELVDEVFVQDHTLHVLLGKKGARGKWRVSYRAVSAEDGHAAKGRYSFTVKGKADCSATDDPSDGPSQDPAPSSSDPPAPSTSGTSGSGLPVIAFLVGGLALAGIALLVRMRS